MIDIQVSNTDAKRLCLFSPKIKPILIDEDYGAVMAVPTVPKCSMRSTEACRTRYAMLSQTAEAH